MGSTTGQKIFINRSDDFHQPFRRRGRAMTKSRSAKSRQIFHSIPSSVPNHFNQDRHPYIRKDYKLNHSAALASGANLLREMQRIAAF